MGERLEVLLQEIREKYLLAGRGKKCIDEMWKGEKTGAGGGGKDGEQRGRKCHPSVYIRGTTFASSL